MATSEQAVLEHVHHMMVNKGEQLKKADRIQRFLGAAAFVIIVGAMLLAEFSSIPDFLCILIGAVGGVVLSVPGYIRIVNTGWPHIAPHIDEKSVKSRLDLVRHK